jgi:hypothetical protein
MNAGILDLGRAATSRLPAKRVFPAPLRHSRNNSFSLFSNELSDFFKEPHDSLARFTFFTT